MRAVLHDPGTAPDDRGDIVLSWLTKIVVVLALAGVVLFDAISIGSTATTVADQGASAAREASATWTKTHNIQSAYNAAVQEAIDENAQNVVATKGFTVDPDGTVHLVISRVAPTLLIYRWSKTATWAKVSSHAEGLDVS